MMIIVVRTPALPPRRLPIVHNPHVLGVDPIPQSTLDPVVHFSTQSDRFPVHLDLLVQFR
jgi:hypothetical protein